MLNKTQLGFEGYTPVNLDTRTELTPYFLDDTFLVHIASEGMEGTNIGTSIQERAYGNQIYEFIAMGHGLVVSYKAQPSEEETYRNQVFGGLRPEWLYIREDLKLEASNHHIAPLDVAVLNDKDLLENLKKKIAEAKRKWKKIALFGYSQTAAMEQIARHLGIPYFGSASFAKWAGSKIGLQEFLGKNDLPGLNTVTVYNKDDIAAGITYLRKLNYTKAVFKVNYSTGGSGHKIVDLDQVSKELNTKNFADIVPEDYYEGEGLVLQGWLPREEQEGLASVDILVDLDGSAHIMHMKTKVGFEKDPLALAGYIPIDARQFEMILPVAEKLKKAYMSAQAIGPHCANLIFPTKEACEKHGLVYGVPLIHDENSRIGAGIMVQNLVKNLHNGKAGVGWVDKTVIPRKLHTFSQILDILRKAGLLIEQASPDAHGVYLYDGTKLINGINRFSMVALSKNQDVAEAVELLENAEKLLNES